MAAPLLIPLISVGLQAAGSLFSFGQAKKAREREQQAQASAAKAMAEAKAELEVNTLRGLSIAKEPYELEREALAQAGASAIQAGVEGDQRGAGAVAGRVLMAQQQQQAQQRAAMSKEMLELEKLGAMEDARLARARAQIDLGESVGQQFAEREARIQAAQQSQAAIGQGAKALIGLGGVLSEAFPGTGEATDAGFDAFTGVTQEEFYGGQGFRPSSVEELLSRQGLGSIPGLGSTISYNPIFSNLPAVPNL